MLLIHPYGGDCQIVVRPYVMPAGSIKNSTVVDVRWHLAPTPRNLLRQYLMLWTVASGSAEYLERFYPDFINIDIFWTM
jgi:hypothetical protein